MSLHVKATHDLQQEHAFATRTNQGLRDGVWRILRIVSFHLERAVKIAMPVLTGRARASWGHWSPIDVKPGAETSGADALWKEEPNNLATTQGSNLVYVPELNRGRSPQAPDGFIDELADQHEDELDRLLDDVLDEWLNKL